MAAGVRRIVPVTLGWEDLPKSVSVEGASHDEYLREPVPGVLLLCDGGWLLLDTGFNVALITDPALHTRFFPSPVEQPVLPGPGEPLAEALAAAEWPFPRRELAEAVRRGYGELPRAARRLPLV